MRLRLFGDSIFRGGAVVRRADLLGPDEARAFPLWPLRTPASVINLALGEEAARMVGRLRMPGAVKESVRDIHAAFASGEVAPDDVVVMLDVGRHSGDPAEHRDGWRRFRQAATEHRAVRLLILEGFDDGAGGQTTHQYDRPFGELTMNQAVREAALEPRPDWAGRTEFVPVSEPMAAYHRWLQAELGASAYRPDGIHLNVWGQFRLCGLLLRAAGPQMEPPLGRLLDAIAPLEPHLELKGPHLRRAVEAAFGPGV